MKFFQKTGVAVTITVLAVVAALVIGFGPSLTGQKTEQTVSQEIPARETTATETPAAEVSGTAGDETISNKYIRDDAGQDLFEDWHPRRHPYDCRHEGDVAGELHEQRL